MPIPFGRPKLPSSQQDLEESARPTYRPPQPSGLSPVLARNIEALQQRRAAEERRSSAADRIAETITRFTGSMPFVVLHVVVFGLWTLINTGLLPVLPRWDASFVILGTSASVEAIFLSTFVLISQNRMAAAADKRADLDLHIGLLAEHEVTKLVTLVSAITDHLGIATEADAEVGELKQDVSPNLVLDTIAETQPGRT
ncbi:DUF1003 domain-containing protein [Methylobacterium sp. Leaf117]|uniref:DUF1003 domain-containing protein n=1 Tax=Methylobacterium sp. Leaf117 TaxID=1736260 RepID=UPI0007000DB2|nr:DUF1003 domain-containing protein [Methylobacterium sp. Leaf117]KQP95996.1 hypothetical protein ASF57_19890 [Methylobacterium sp. Leaf117]